MSDDESKRYEELGRAVDSVLLRDYAQFILNTRRRMFMSFLTGIASGFGGVIGATLVVAWLLLAMRYLGGAPLVGHILREIGDTISKGRPR